ncbi:MAG: glycosyltransferase family 2 protein [Parvularculaceae bacterium]
MTAPGTGIGERQAPTFSVIIVNYRAGDRLRRCLDRLTRQTLAPFEVIVVDNGSDDGSLVEARRSAQAFRLISPSTNLGFAAANNRAA